ncbi:unnamed protein product [Acanthoscelides obtectus]|uniref:Uncharacterized protein n=1 Tax=Acanthoscelides obtectus TaxID=200917 RepID=A0A9P0VQ11_ACAOB|nr:unnamed protein product [Acanthoscelides obtectus]CAK1683541.1 hypothetical protein AOBTE_LOCUS34299 [Acanthoscelides obtectus]
MCSISSSLRICEIVNWLKNPRNSNLNFCLQWDCNRSYRELPFILDGGLKEFVQCYPSEPQEDFIETSWLIRHILWAHIAKPVERDFSAEDEDHEVALKLRNIRSEGALPKNSYFAKEPGVSSGTYTSISEHRFPMEYNKGNINPAASTDFMKPQDMSSNGMRVTKTTQGHLIDGEIILQSRWTMLCQLVSPPPSFDRSFKPAKVKEPEKDVKGRGFTGIRNYKNCCFKSAILQCMKTLPFIKEYFVNTNRYLTLNRRVPPVFNILMGEVRFS